MKAQGGFTLVELAITLMVIGLLIGGVLKGQELIENARLTRIVKDLNDYDTAVRLFDSTYGDLPGDMVEPTRLPNCDTAPCNNTEGVGTRDYHTSNNTYGQTKRGNFWRHLYRAGFIESIFDDSENAYKVSPLNGLGGHNGVYTGGIGGPAEIGTINALIPSEPEFSGPRFRGTKRVKNIDMKMDDGNPVKGIILMRYGNTTGFGEPHPQTCYDETTLEYLEDSSLVCLLFFRAPSMN